MQFALFFVILPNKNKANVMSRITIKDKAFEVSIPEAEIQERVRAVADRINHDLEGQKPVFLAVLNGSFVFAADLIRCINIPSEISFVRLQSYAATESTGVVKEIRGLTTDIKGRNVVIVEDIVDTGRTMSHMVESLQKYHPNSIRICTLLLKPGKLTVPLDVEYAALRIPNDFIVGYGLDYDQVGRGLRDIYTLGEK